MFFTRLFSGIILVLAAIFFFVQGGYFLLFALAVLSLLGLYELLRVLQMEKSSLAVVTYVATAVYYSMLCIYGGIDWLLLGLLIFMMLALLVIYVFSYPKLRIEDITKAVFAFLYVSVLFSYIARTRDLVAGNWLVWLIIISAWGSDTFAYLTGVLIGKHHWWCCRCRTAWFLLCLFLSGICRFYSKSIYRISVGYSDWSVDFAGW